MPFSRLALFPLLLSVVLAHAAHAGETRTFEVTFRGRPVGTAVLSVRDDPGGLTTYVHHSRLTSVRDGAKAERILHEEVRVRDGLFVSAFALREAGDDRLAVSAWWDARSGTILVRRGAGRLERVSPGDPAGVETLFDAPRRLIEAGAQGARRRVFDLPDAHVGWVVLEKARGPDGWAETNELGIRVRSRWAPGARLPDVMELPDAGLVYTATGIERGSRAAEPAELAGGGVKLEGTASPGAQVRLVPRDAWPGVPCAGSPVPLTDHGAICVMDESGPATRPQAGPEVRALAASIAGGTPLERAAALAKAIDARLTERPGGAALWEANVEGALLRGAGDCNEAAAIFMAAAPLVKLQARRRTGLVADPDAPGRLWPHAWVEVRVGPSWVRVDPARGEAPARGLYLDLGDGERVASRLRAIAPVLRGARVEVVGAPQPAP